MSIPAYETMADIVAEVTAADINGFSLPELDALSRRMTAVRPVPMRDAVRTAALFLTTSARRRIRELDPAMTGCDGEATS